MKLKSGGNGAQLQFFDADGTTLGGFISWNDGNSRILIGNSQTGEQISMSGNQINLSIGGSPQIQIVSNLATFAGAATFGGDVSLSGASGNRTLNIQTNTSGDAIINLTAAGSDGGAITYKRSTSEMIFSNSSAANALTISSGGDILLSSTEGKIGIKDSNSIYIGNFEGNNVGRRFIGVTNDIRPCTSSGDNQDNTVDLGDANARFKDFYLSGGVYLGGTAAVNKLDAYEEGSWTPTLPFGGTVATVYAATYVIIGKLLSYQFYIACSGIPSNGNRFEVSMPKTPSFANTYWGGNIAFSSSFNSSTWRPIVGPTRLYFEDELTGGPVINSAASGLPVFIVSGNYYV